MIVAIFYSTIYRQFQRLLIVIHFTNFMPWLLERRYYFMILFVFFNFVFCFLFLYLCFFICLSAIYQKQKKQQKKTQLQFAVNLIVEVINFIAMERRKPITSSNNYIKIIIANILPLITTLHTKLIRFHSNCWLSKISFYDNVFHLLFNDKILNFLWSIFIMAFPIIFIIVIWIMIALFMASWRL